jgi:hypothetical protein
MTSLRTFAFACMSAVTFAGAAMAAPAATTVIAADAAQPLTLTAAKQIVARRLAETGKSKLRPGRAEFDGDGNVSVEIVNIGGLPISHVLVNAKSGQVTDSRTGTPLSMRG